MINRRNHPVGWAQLMSHLNDARDHLSTLITEAEADAEYAEENFRVDLGHVLAHIHRAWYCRNSPNNLSDAEWEKARDTPQDLDPIA